MTDEVAVQAAEFQETILRSVAQHKAPYVVELKGVEYVMFPETFNPVYAKASLLLLDNLGVEEGDTVLDPFTGTGADAIFAVKEGAEYAVAVDKFTMSVLCAKYNAYQLGLQGCVDVRRGDVFDPVGEDEAFSLVVANPPFKRMEPDSVMEPAVRDEQYKTLRRFFTDVSEYLTEDGRIRLVFSNVGDMEYMQALAMENSFECSVVAETRFADKVSIKVFELVQE